MVVGDESVPVDAIGHGDVIQDPGNGKWITVTRVVSGTVRVTSEQPISAAAEDVAGPFWSFYGDERLDEVITLRGEAPRVRRRVG
ncbi:MAG: hypothetical protein ABW137_03395 [Mycobacterium sp.]